MIRIKLQLLETDIKVTIIGAEKESIYFGGESKKVSVV